MAEGQGAVLGQATAKIRLDSSGLVSQTRVVIAAGKDMAKALIAASHEVQAARKVELAQIQQTTAVVRAQQSQISAIARAESSVRIAAAKAESAARQQAARVDANAAIEEQRRVTAAFKAELRAREQENRRAQASTGSFMRGAAGAAFGAMGGPVGALAGSLAGGGAGLAAGVGFAAVEMGRFAIDASKTATAYDRQRVAAVSLAGSQAKLNELLESYHKVTGNAVDDAQALADVSSLVTQGFAKNATQLETFLRGVRGASVATGRPQEFIIERTQFEMLNQTGQRLNEIGLSMAEVRTRADQLAAANKSLSKEEAYQQAVLTSLNDKFGALSKSAEAQATGVEQLAKSWKNLRLEIGQVAGGAVNPVAGFFAKGLDAEIERWKNFGLVIRQVRVEMQQLGLVNPAPMALPTLTPSAAHGIGAPGGTGGSRFTEEQTDTIVQWNKARIDLERQTGEQIAQETKQFGKQRADTIANYEKQISREAADWASQRAEQEQNLQEQIADIGADAARQRVRWERDLAQSIAQAQADSAERVADFGRDHDERIGDARRESTERLADAQKETDERVAKERADSVKRLAELEADYNKSRERATAEYQLDRENAAGRLDARALFEMDRQHELENKLAEETHNQQIAEEKSRLADFEKEQNDAHAKAIAKEKANLQEFIDEENKAHAERLSDEAKALDKSIKQQQAAHAQRLADQVAADELRVEDMKKAFANEQTEAAADRQVRLGRQAQDHQDQLNALDSAHQDRLTQIGTHAKQERDALDTEFKTELAALKVHVDGWAAENTRATNSALLEFDKWIKHVKEEFTKLGIPIGPPTAPGTNPSLDPRRQQLNAELERLQQESANTPINSPRWLELNRRVMEIEEELRKLGGGTAGVAGIAGPVVPRAGFSSATPYAMSSWAMMAGTRAYAMPAPVAAAASVGGVSGGGVSFGDINITVHGVPGQTANELADIIDQRIIYTVRRAAGRA